MISIGEGNTIIMLEYLVRIKSLWKAACILVLISFTSGCLFECEDTIVSRSSSSDGKFKVIAYHRDCGATTSVATIIKILEQNEPFDPDSEKGDVYIAEGVEQIEVEWIADYELEVKAIGNIEVFLKNESLGSVSINYL